jgi:hypothetical protein
MSVGPQGDIVLALSQEERSDLSLLLRWWSAEERARGTHLHPRLRSRHGALLLKILLLAVSNEERALNKRHFKDEVIKAFNVAPEMVDDRIKNLEDIGYLETMKSHDGRDKILVASETAYADLAHYAGELIRSIAASSRVAPTGWRAGVGQRDVRGAH